MKITRYIKGGVSYQKWIKRSKGHIVNWYSTLKKLEYAHGSK